MTAADLNFAKSQADGLFRRKRLIGFGIPAVIVLYLSYIFFAFDLPGLAQRASLDNAVTLVSDSWSHKVHVTRNNRTPVKWNMPSRVNGRGAIPKINAPIGSAEMRL